LQTPVATTPGGLTNSPLYHSDDLLNDVLIQRAFSTSDLFLAPGRRSTSLARCGRYYHSTERRASSSSDFSAVDPAQTVPRLWRTTTAGAVGHYSWAIEARNFHFPERRVTACTGARSACATKRFSSRASARTGGKHGGAIRQTCTSNARPDWVESDLRIRDLGNRAVSCKNWVPHHSPVVHTSNGQGA